MIVYKITNLLNGKSYVGKTKHPLYVRWSQHKLSAKKGSKAPFHKALRKYGTDSWKLEIICKASSLEELAKKEKQYISLGDHSYNATPESSLSGRLWTTEEKQTRKKAPWFSTPEPIVCLTTGKKFSSIVEASKLLLIPHSSIAAVCRGRKDSTKGLKFDFVNMHKKIKADNLRTERAVKRKALSVGGKQIEDMVSGLRFNSIKETSKHYGVSPSTIGRFLKEGHGKCKGLKLRYLEVSNGY